MNWRVVIVMVLVVGIWGCRSAPVREETRAVPKIGAFQGEYRFLSNFWPAEVVDEGITYPTAEHAYQAAKSLDMGGRRRIARIATPGEAKRAGEAMALRPDWEGIKYGVMLRCVR